jgi:hypothetical protein
MVGYQTLIGFRIEFRESGKLLGAAYCEDSYLAVAVPRAGDLVSSRIIGGIVPPRWLPVPFMEVAAVEHYPAKPPDQPGVQVVIRLETPGATMGEVRALEAIGWIVELLTKASEIEQPESNPDPTVVSAPPGNSDCRASISASRGVWCQDE